MTVNYGEEVVEIVGDSSGQAADGLHLLSLAKLLLELRSGRLGFFGGTDVHGHAAHPDRISVLIEDHGRAGLDPHMPSVRGNPAETADAALSGL